MRVLELWRYPVKSLQGERLDTADVGPLGIAGDRGWALFDVGSGYGLTARRVPQLLFARGRLRADGAAEIVLPDGTVTGNDAVLSDWLGRGVTLRSAAGLRPRYESPDDDEESGGWHVWEGAGGALHDMPSARVSLVSTGTVGEWHPRRFRANVLLEGADEDALIGSRVRLGGAVLDVGCGIPRCVMVTRPQPDGIEKDPTVLRTIHRDRDGLLAVAASVAGTGTIAVGDRLTVL